MENRLKLNKKIKYELPDEVIIGEYRRTCTPPKFEPDICITTFGNIEVKDKEATCLQIWIKTDNKELINFIKTFNFENKLNKTTNAYRMNINIFKKILLEEFYGVNNGE